MIIPRSNVVHPDPCLPRRPSRAPHQPSQRELRGRVLERARLVQKPGQAALENEAAVSLRSFGLHTKIVLAQLERVECADQVELKDWQRRSGRFGSRI
jgi:hypothetical protein